MNFRELGLSEKVLQAVEASGYTTPTPIQAKAIPEALAGRDVLGIAQTGTCKTAAFTLPMAVPARAGPRPRARAAHPHSRADPRARRPGRGEFRPLRRRTTSSTWPLLIGGVSFGDQETKIIRGADVLIATPALTLLDFFGTRQAAFDRHRNSGHRRSRPHARHGLHPGHRAHLQAGAFHPSDPVLLGDHAAGDHPPDRATFLHNPARVEVAPAARSPSTITQALVASAPGGGDKRATLRRLLRAAEDLKNAIVFCNRKRDVAVLHKSLLKTTAFRWRAAWRHGSGARMNSLDAFKNGAVDLWSVPTLRRAVSIFPTSVMSSISTLRPIRRLCPSHRPHRPRRQVGHGIFDCHTGGPETCRRN